MVTHKSLQRIDGQRLIKLLPIARLFARMATDSATDAGKRVLLHNDLPGSVKAAVLCLAKEARNIDSSRAGLPAGGNPGHENRSKLPPVSCPIIDGGPPLNNGADGSFHSSSFRLYSWAFRAISRF